MSRTVNPTDVKTLSDWGSRWGKYKNLGFDPESREPTVYAKEDSTTRVSSFPWKREGDVMTILTNSQRFGEGAVRVAQERYTRIQDERDLQVKGIVDPLIRAEKTLLDAWQRYHVAQVEDRPQIRAEIVAAEKTVRQLESTLATYKYKQRQLRTLEEYSTAYVPPILIAKRGIPLAEAATT